MSVSKKKTFGDFLQFLRLSDATPLPKDHACYAKEWSTLLGTALGPFPIDFVHGTFVYDNARVVQRAKFPCRFQEVSLSPENRATLGLLE